jgi:periplasmic protein TonB
METNKILSADVLDILFDGRNKEYGAYALRKGYNGRLGRSLLVVGGVVIVLFCFGFVSGRGHVATAPGVKDVVIAPPPTTSLVTPPPPVIPKPQPPVATIRVTPPRVVPDDQVKPDEAPPENKDIDQVKISNETKDGINGPGVEAAPLNSGNGNVIEKPKPDDDGNTIFTKVEVDASYPGGMPAWARFLHKNLNYPQDALEKDIQGSVMVQFIVDKEGNVSDIEIISGPTDGGLREEAIRVIRKSGKWTPAIQNGRVVKSYKRQPLIFQTTEQ